VKIKGIKRKAGTQILNYVTILMTVTVMYIWRYLYWFNEFKAFGISGILICVLYL